MDFLAIRPAAGTDRNAATWGSIEVEVHTGDVDKSVHLEANVSRLLEANADGIVVVDEDGRICFANPAAAALFGRPRDALVGGDFGFPVVAGATTELDVVTGSEPTVVEMRVVAVTWEGAPAYLASMRDITERKRAEAERAQLLLEQAARANAEAAVRARDEFLAVVAHELKTPLTRLRLATQRLLRRLDHRMPVATRQLDETLRAIDGETVVLSQMVIQLIVISRLEDGTFALKPSPIDLRELLAQTVKSTRPVGRPRRIDLSMPERPVTAMVDRILFEQVLASLIANAVRFSPESAAIDVELATRQPEPDRPDDHPIAVISVRDRGEGIPPELRDRLFDRFFRAHVSTHMSGVGLGLYTSRQIVELHGGTIGAEFPEDGGSRFVIQIPID